MIDSDIDRPSEPHPVCAVCGSPASCLGSYETDEAWAYACDACCGHGNEDGRCYSLGDVPARFQGLVNRCAMLDDADVQAQARSELATLKAKLLLRSVVDEKQLEALEDQNRQLAEEIERLKAAPLAIDDEFEPDPEPFFARIAELIGCVSRANGHSAAEYASEETVFRAVVDMRAAWLRSRDPAPPLHILLWCPECRCRHIDDGEFATKPHHTHCCQHCGHVWRPAIVRTVGVRFLPGYKN